ncbi:helix-turn-helix domain-containing protein [Leucobacter chromiiresistens]
MAIQTNADVASLVRGAMAERGVRQSDVAQALGVSRMAVSRRLSGETSFSAEELIVLRDVLGVPVGRFFGEQTLPLDSGARRRGGRAA